MMSDLIERLRISHRDLEARLDRLNTICEYARNEIKDQRAEIKRLRAALERVGPGKWNGCEDCEYSTRIAREALNLAKL
jgi:RNA polymerase-binding transcription factor DksA